MLDPVSSVFRSSERRPAVLAATNLDGGLVAGSCQGKGERQCGTEQLIDPHSFFSEEPGQVDPVEKTDDAGDKTGDRQNQSTEDQRMTFGMLHSFSLDPLQIKILQKYIPSTLLTELRGECYHE